MTQNLPPLLVLETKYAEGWDGLEADLEHLELHPLIDEVNPFTDIEYATDAHCTAYGVTGEELMPRLNKGAASALEALGAPVVKRWAIVDIDNAHVGHAEWTPDLRAKTFEALRKLPEFGHAGWYLTKHGLRLVWPLNAPLDVRVAEDWQRMLLDHIDAATGLRCDRGCLDWTRVFRLPNGVRNGVRQDLDLDFTSMRPLTWTPPRAPLVGSLRSHVERAEHGERPEAISKPRKRDYAGLEELAHYHRLLDGASLAQAGERNSTTMSVLGQVVRRLNVSDPYLVYKLLHRSVQAQVDAGSKWSLDWLWDRCCYVVENHAAEVASLAEVKRAFGSGAVIDEAEELSLLEQAAEVIGVPEDDVHHHLIIVCQTTHYVFNEHTMSYGPPVPSKLLFQQLTRYCGVLAGRVATELGAAPTVDEMLRRYGQVVEEVELVFGKRGNTYDPARNVMVEGCGAIREDLEPRFHPDVDRWLRLLGGDEADHLLDWLATLLQLDTPTCALYLRGRNSLGKGMLAEGLAQLWERPLTEYGELTSNFTEELTRCPIVWADEKLPVSHLNASAVFRKLIGSSMVPVKRKYKSNATLIGCPRVLITANNDDALSMRERLTEDDLKAIQLRIGYIHCPDDAADYLVELGGRPYTERWVNGCAIAEHVLWLNEEREVVPGSRYLVEGWASDLTTNLATLSGFAGNVVVAIATLIGEERMKDLPRCQVGDGEVLINARELQRNWRVLTGPDQQTPREFELTDALSTVSLGKRRKRMLGKHVSLWAIDPTHIYAVAERQHLFDVEELKRVVDRVLPKLVTPDDEPVDGEQTA